MPNTVRNPRGEATRQQLVAATLDAIREAGFARLSARAVADRAGINQALIFYHYGSMDALVAATVRVATAERVAVWAPELDRVRSLDDLVDVARRLHAGEEAEGNVSVLAQALAASHADAGLARVIGEAFELWLEHVEAATSRVLAGTIVEELVSPRDVARTVAAAFVGMELFEGVVRRQDDDPFGVLERLAGLAQLALEPGRLTRAAVRRRLRTTARRG